MKKFTFLFLLIVYFGCVGYSQDYSGVVQVPDRSKDDLYNLGIEWVVKIFNSPNDVIQLKNPEAGKIIVKALFIYTESSPLLTLARDCDYILTIDFKDGRYRYEFSNLVVTTEVSGYSFTNENLPSVYFSDTTTELIAKRFSNENQPVPGKRKLEKILDLYLTNRLNFDNYFNGLANSLKKHVSKPVNEW